MTSQPPSSSSSNARELLQNFQFTFNLSDINSGRSSTVNPDPSTDDLESSESLSESVQDFPEEFGRTYHAYRLGSYAFPNDFLECERLDSQNETLTALFEGRLFFAPLPQTSPPRAILDIATGTGDWAIQMGDLFPESQIIATDLSPIQPADVPPNVNFYVEDSSEPWEYSQKFDYIHTRITAGCWSSFETQIAQQALEALSPGSYFESQELDCMVRCDDGSLPDDSALSRWFHEMNIAGERCNRPLDMAAHLKDIYERVGFVDVREHIFRIPTNGWPRDDKMRELGKMWERNLMQGLSGFSFALFNRAFGRSAAEVEVSLVDVRRECSDPRIHAYMLVHVVWGRKPYPGERPGSITKF